MSKLFRKCAAVALFLCLGGTSAWARDPVEALSARGDDSIFWTARIGDLGGMLRGVFSPGNVEMLTSVMPPEEAQGVRLVGSMVAGIPVKSVAFNAGSMADGQPFFQVAASMSPAQQAKLDLVAAGKASPEDIVTLVLGDGGLLLATAVQATKVQDGKAAYYLINDAVALTAKDDLLLMALRPQDLQNSLEALADAGKRLNLKRKYESPSFWYLNADVKTAFAFADKTARKEIDVDAILKIFKAPLKMEMGFDSSPNNYRISAWINAFESISTMERFKDAKPAAGANLFRVGAGKLLFGLAGATFFNLDDLKIYPEIEKEWDKFTKELSKRGIAEADLQNLLSGTVSMVAGVDATFGDHRIPGGYLALTGKEGAALKLLSAFLEDEEVVKAGAFAPMKLDGWSSLVRVDPALAPVPVLLGVQGETLFLGIVDPEGLTKKPEVGAETAKLLEEKSFSSAFLDVTSAWDYLRREMADPKSPLAAALKTQSARDAELVAFLMEAEPSVGFVKVWTPTLDTSFCDFKLLDVPAEKRLLGRLLQAAEKFNYGGSSLVDEDDIGDTPLEVLLTIKGIVEEDLASNPKAGLEVYRDAFGEVAAIVELPDGRLFAGTPVTDDDDRLELIESTKKFGLQGSSALDALPDGTAYTGQETVWIRIER